MVWLLARPVQALAFAQGQGLAPPVACLCGLEVQAVRPQAVRIKARPAQAVQAQAGWVMAGPAQAVHVPGLWCWGSWCPAEALQDVQVGQALAVQPLWLQPWQRCVGGHRHQGPQS